MAQTVRVNFSKPMPLFPLDGAVLLPHAVQPLLIFEPRYRQMLEDSIDESGQIAMASFAGAGGCGRQPRLRPAVCIGQIVQHRKLEDGRYYILLHGVCRATIVEMIEPEGGRLYRMARLVPIEPITEKPPQLQQVRERLRSVLRSRRLRCLRGVDAVLEWFEREDVPTHALLELVSFTLVQDPELRYRLLAEADASRRARLLQNELDSIERLIVQASRQSYRGWPKGMSWN